MPGVHVQLADAVEGLSSLITAYLTFLLMHGTCNQTNWRTKDTLNTAMKG